MSRESDIFITYRQIYATTLLVALNSDLCRMRIFSEDGSSLNIKLCIDGFQYKLDLCLLGGRLVWKGLRGGPVFAHLFVIFGRV